MTSTDVLEDVFHAPALDDYLTSVLNSYKVERDNIERVSAAMNEAGANDCLRYFMQANTDGRGYIRTSLFDLKPAICALDACYWSNVMQHSKLLDVMPAKRRDEWRKQVEECKTPEFTREAVVATFRELNAQKHMFMAEKVDGIFRSLSHEHVTNSPQGFAKRMIVAGVTDGGEYQFTRYQRCDIIDDLRDVIASLRGIIAKSGELTHQTVDDMKKNTGTWYIIDGGAMRMRLYKVGTAHIEIHPDIAWRLNKILAYLHPTAIPAEFRVKPKKQLKEIWRLQKPLSREVINALSDGFRGKNTYCHKYELDKHLKRQVEEVLTAMGGVAGQYMWSFEYDVHAGVLEHILSSGCIPDSKSHQFYPTPEALALKAVELAQIGETDICLEPSAGTGAIAKHMPIERTSCVEVSEMRCEALRAMGFITNSDDFLDWVKHIGDHRFTRIVMNPPFDRGQWQAHLEAAAGMLKAGGRVVAILPASAKDRLPRIDGVAWEHHGVYDDAFDGTSISVCIVAGQKGA